jgi:hypothetical protein
MKKYIFILLFLFATAYSFAQEEKPLYSGGMLIFQPGYSFAQNQYQKIETLGFGIGGILRFYVSNHLAVGIIGGSQKTSYISANSDNSYLSLGYGGVFSAFTIKTSKMRFCAGISIAKGRIKNLHIQSQTGVALDDAALFSYPAWVGYPMLSADYFLTKKISLTSQVICLTALYNQNEVFISPVFQLGVLFNR